MRVKSYLKEVVNAVSSKGQTIEEVKRRIAVRNELEDGAVNFQAVKRCLDYLLRKGTVDIVWEMRNDSHDNQIEIMTYKANVKFEKSNEFRKYAEPNELEDVVTAQA